MDECPVLTLKLGNVSIPCKWSKLLNQDKVSHLAHISLDSVHRSHSPET